MNDITTGLDQNKEDLLIYEIPDDVLEAAYTGNEKAGNFTAWWGCTSLYYCPIAPARSGCGN